MSTTHRFRTDLVWSGSTALGYRRHDRCHQASAPPAAARLDLSSDPAFGGDAQHLNPEQLLLAAASSCQLLSFLALAARVGVDVVHYEDDAEATMPEIADHMRITEITLRPQIVVSRDTDLAAVVELVHRAHGECFIANTLNARVVLEPAVEHAGPAPTPAPVADRTGARA